MHACLNSSQITLLKKVKYFIFTFIYFCVPTAFIFGVQIHSYSDPFLNSIENYSLIT